MQQSVSLEVRQRDGLFCVISKSGRNMGCYDSQAEAEERLQQIERFAGSTKDEDDERYQLAYDPDEIVNIRKRWKAVVNMSASELRSWAETQCSSLASLDHDAVVRRNLRLLETPADEWDQRDARDANRAISFISRMRGAEQGDPAREGCPSKRDISLKNWGYDPKKERRAALAIDASEPVVDRPGVKRAWLDLTREGDFAGYPTADGEGIKITRRTIEELLASVKRAETPIPVDGGGISQPHEMVRDSGAPAAGWILDATITEDKKGRAHLWGWVELLPEVAQAIDAGALLYGSVAYDESSIDRESGEPVGAQLHSYALTNKPFVPGLHPHRLDREMPGRRLVAASIEATQIVVAQPEERMSETNNPTAGADVAAEAVTALSEQLSEAQVKIVELSAELEAYRAEEERRKEEAAAAQLAADVEQVCEQQNIRLGEEAKTHLVALAASQGVEAVKATIAAINVPPVGVTMSDKPAAKRYSDKDEAIRALSAEVKSEQPEANQYTVMRETLRRLSKNHPELV